MILKDVEPLEVMVFDGKSKDFVLGAAYVLEIIDELPEIHGVDEIVGKWNELKNCANEGVYCSVCGKKVYKLDYANQKVRSKYCPNCGARMEISR